MGVCRARVMFEKEETVNVGLALNHGVGLLRVRALQAMQGAEGQFLNKTNPKINSSDSSSLCAVLIFTLNGTPMK